MERKFLKYILSIFITLMVLNTPSYGGSDLLTDIIIEEENNITHAPEMIFDEIINSQKIDNTDSKKPTKGSNIISEMTQTNIGGEPAILIKGDKNTSKSIKHESNPNRIVIDINNSKLDPKLKKKINFNVGNIKHIELSESISTGDLDGEDHIVQINCYLENNGSLSDIEFLENGNNIVIKENKELWDNISFNPNTKTISFHNIKGGKPQVYYDEKERVLELFIPRDNIKLETGNLSINDNLIGELNIEESNSFHHIKFTLKHPITYSISQDNNSYSITFKEVKDINSNQRLIVIDAGHGGHDGGASPRTVVEKNVALDVSLKVNRILKERGYNTIMLRDKDVFIDRFERAKLTNAHYPDIFLSIHCNSANASAASGIETYYYEQGVEKDLKERRKYLASSIQEALINNTKAINRGVKTNSFTVIKNTNMPSVLIETGFLSNPKEELLLNTDSYQEKLARGIADGVEKYFLKY